MVTNVDGSKASDSIRKKLIESGGTATIHTLQGKAFNITITCDGKAFETPKLPQVNYEFTVFDIIVDLLREKNGKARKGMGRGTSKLGDPGCELDTVVGTVAHRYAGKQVGESVYDPVFALAAILEWAEICYNERGVLILRNHQ